MSRRSVLMEALAATPRDLARLLRPVDDTVARVRPAPDEWRLADVVAHLGFVEGRYLARLRRVVAEENPRVEAIADGAGTRDSDRPLPALLEAFAARRAETIAFLSGLSQRDWGRPLVHETLGPTRLRDQVQALVAHDNEHLEQIITLRERVEATQ